jgi:hypothetical protein
MLNVVEFVDVVAEFSTSCSWTCTCLNLYISGLYTYFVAKALSHLVVEF